VFKLGSDAVDPVPAARFDALYAAFEDAFRGPPDVMRRRLALYLPAVREAQAGAPTRPVLDLGSGRGEWLTLLREEGLEARGVEINALTAHASRDAGLDVATADLFAHLKTTADASLGAVTSFHVIEHIAFEALVQLLAQAHRTLKPGGLLLLETPNPENTVVGSCNFYADPTHRRPIPPETLAFLVRNAGFGAVTIRRLWEDRVADPWAHEAAVKPARVQRAIDIVRTNFFAPPDYAVLATRP
jgi:O-antigen chain-terminating methyltransferase